MSAAASGGEAAADLHLLRQVLTSYLLSDAWDALRERVLARVRKCGEKWQDKLVTKQLFYLVIGPELRRRLGVAAEFEPTLLIEPYVLRKERLVLSARISKHLINSLLEDLAAGPTTPVFRASDAYLERACAVFAHHFKTEWCGDAFEFSDLLGCALVRLLHRNTYATLASLLRLRDDGDALAAPISINVSPDDGGIMEGGIADNLLLSSVLVNATDTRRPNQQQHSSYDDAAAQTDPLLESYRLTQEREGHGSILSQEGTVDHHASSSSSSSGVYSLGLTDRAQYVRLFQQLSGQSDDVGMAMAWFQPAAVSSLCAGLLGSLLSDRLRRCLWAYRLCVSAEMVGTGLGGMQAFGASPALGSHTAPFRYVADLTRMSSLKNVSYLKSTPILNATRRYLRGLAPRAFPLLYSMIAAASIAAAGAGAAHHQSHLSSSADTTDAILDSAQFAVLLKRAEALVSALYVLHGVISDRSVMLALLLVRVLCCDVHLPKAQRDSSLSTAAVSITGTTVPPVSELVLAVYHRLLGTWLPTDVPDAEYNYLSTNDAVWEILGREDPQLLEHLHAHLASDPYLDPNEALRRRHAVAARNNAFLNQKDASSTTGGAASSIREFTIDNDTMGGDHGYAGIGAASHRHRDMPWGLHLIKGWMDTGFLGWVPEHGVMFMFDQMAMLDSSAMAGGGGVGYHVHKRFFSRICVQMLKMHRESLMATREDFLETLRSSCRKTSSKAIFAAVCECLVLIPQDDTAEEAARRRDYKAAVVIQRCARGMLGRHRMARVRDERRQRLKRKGGLATKDHGGGESNVWMQRLALDNLTLPGQRGHASSPSRGSRSRYGLDDRQLYIPSGRNERHVDVYDDPSGHMLHDVYTAPIAEPSQEHYLRAQALLRPSYRMRSSDDDLHPLGPYILAPTYTDIVNKINSLSNLDENAEEAGPNGGSGGPTLNAKQRMDLAHAILLDGELRGARRPSMDEAVARDDHETHHDDATEETTEMKASDRPPNSLLASPGGRARAALRKAVAVARVQSRKSLVASDGSA